MSHPDSRQYLGFISPGCSFVQVVFPVRRKTELNLGLRKLLHSKMETENSDSLCSIHCGTFWADQKLNTSRSLMFSFLTTQENFIFKLYLNIQKHCFINNSFWIECFTFKSIEILLSVFNCSNVLNINKEDTSTE